MTNNNTISNTTNMERAIRLHLSVDQVYLVEYRFWWLEQEYDEDPCETSMGDKQPWTGLEIYNWLSRILVEDIETIIDPETGDEFHSTADLTITENSIEVYHQSFSGDDITHEKITILENITAVLPKLGK